MGHGGEQIINIINIPPRWKEEEEEEEEEERKRTGCKPDDTVTFLSEMSHYTRHDEENTVSCGD